MHDCVFNNLLKFSFAKHSLFKDGTFVIDHKNLWIASDLIQLGDGTREAIPYAGPSELTRFLSG